MDHTAFQKQADELMARFGNKYGFEAAYAFLDLHLKWAAACEGNDPAQAIEQYKLAEDCQSTIGTFATGSGEGLASMAALYKIMGMRAEAEERLGHLQSALEIWKKISIDPNQLGDGTPARMKILRLQNRIANLKT